MRINFKRLLNIVVAITWVLLVVAFAAFVFYGFQTQCDGVDIYYKCARS